MSWTQPPTNHSEVQREGGSKATDEVQVSQGLRRLVSGQLRPEQRDYLIEEEILVSQLS